MTRRSTKNQIDWEYCECGCHGFETSILGQYFWASVNLSNDTIDLFEGENGGYGLKLGTFETFTAADKAIVDKIRASGIMGQLEDELRKVKKLLKQ